jgi:tetratricopeptide (TPR) repeat protein
MMRDWLVGAASWVAVGVLLAAGCDKNRPGDPQDDPAPQQEQAKRSSDPFETSDDPPLTASTRFAAGQLAEGQGNTEAAILQYREALKIDPNHQQALFRLGAVLTQNKRFDEALATWQRYLKVTKQAPAAYNNLALCYEAADRTDDAEQAYQAGIARDPKDSSCRVNYGIMLARKGRLEDATTQLSTVLAPAEVQYNLGSVFEQTGHIEQAKAYYRKALELDPRLTDARSRLAHLK